MPRNPWNPREQAATHFLCAPSSPPPQAATPTHGRFSPHSRRACSVSNTVPVFRWVVIDCAAIQPRGGIRPALTVSVICYYHWLKKKELPYFGNSFPYSGWADLASSRTLPVCSFQPACAGCRAHPWALFAAFAARLLRFKYAQPSPSLLSATITGLKKRNCHTLAIPSRTRAGRI